MQTSARRIIHLCTQRGLLDDIVAYPLEDWMFVDLKFGHMLPVLSGIDLNRTSTCEPLGTVYYLADSVL